MPAQTSHERLCEDSDRTRKGRKQSITEQAQTTLTRHLSNSYQLCRFTLTKIP